MAKLALNNIDNLLFPSTAVINSNNDAIEVAFENTLSRDGTSPNSMNADFDMNSNRILNLPSPSSALEPLRLQDLTDFVGGEVVFDDKFITVQGAFSQANVQTAINTAIAQGKWLILPRGICFLTSPLIINGPIRIYGQGQYSNASASMFWLGTLNQNGFEITTDSDVLIDGLQVQALGSPTSGAGIYADPGSGRTINAMIFQNIQFHNCFHGINMIRSGDWRAENVECLFFNSPRGAQIRIDNVDNGDAGAAVIKDCKFWSDTTITPSDVGIEIVSTGDIRLIHNNFVNTHTGVRINFRSGANSGQILMNDNIFDGCIGRGVSLGSAGGNFFNVNVSGNIFRMVEDGIGILSDSTVGAHMGICVISGNTFSVGSNIGDDGIGIYFQGGSHTYIVGNTFHNGLSTTSRGVLIENGTTNVNVALDNKFRGFNGAVQTLTNNSVSRTPDIAGWGAPTGTATRTTFATNTVTTEQLAQRVKALIDDLTTREVLGA